MAFSNSSYNFYCDLIFYCNFNLILYYRVNVNTLIRYFNTNKKAKPHSIFPPFFCSFIFPPSTYWKNSYSMHIS